MRRLGKRPLLKRAVAMAVPAVAVLVAMSGTPASAQVTGHYNTEAFDLVCNNTPGPGGTVASRVMSFEVRRIEGGVFHAKSVLSRLRLQHQNLDGSWTTVQVGRVHEGVPGFIDHAAGSMFLNFQYDGVGNTTPRLTISTTGHGVFRVVGVTRFYNRYGIELARVRDVSRAGEFGPSRCIF